MDHHKVEFISSILILLATTFVKHIGLIEATPLIDLAQRAEIETPLLSSHVDRSGTYSFAGYTMRVEKGAVGAYAQLQLLSPIVTASDWSSTLVSIGKEGWRGVKTELNGGWMVNPNEFQDTHPRIFASYKIGDDWCYSYNPNCTEFVVTDQNAFVPLTNISGGLPGVPAVIEVFIIQDNDTEDWHLTVSVGGNDPIEVGYWKSRGVSELNGRANIIMWGGKVYRSSNLSSNRLRMMGNGKTPEEEEGFRVGCIRDMHVFDTSYRTNQPLGKQLRAYETNKTLYRVSPVSKIPLALGGMFFYGGPGNPS